MTASRDQLASKVSEYPCCCSLYQSLAVKSLYVKCSTPHHHAEASNQDAAHKHCHTKMCSAALFSAMIEQHCQEHNRRLYAAAPGNRHPLQRCCSIVLQGAVLSYTCRGPGMQRNTQARSATVLVPMLQKQADLHVG